MNMSLDITDGQERPGGQRIDFSELGVLGSKSDKGCRTKSWHSESEYRFHRWPGEQCIDFPGGQCIGGVLGSKSAKGCLNRKLTF
ncbi:hypothetical protein CEXT_713831 [Caerostris extrusa]|uniref:Uncharacterized protein n=1 Tax=Caerostris extrusa TaxID=172846 RepID=A0AAV4S9K9_CAEEX|nr:hypothetical protein CEXT_713831 [Caerostris extrusa]